jgi:hypothetical protein
MIYKIVININYKIFHCNVNDYAIVNLLPVGDKKS